VTFIFLLRREVEIIPDSTPTFLRHPEDLATLASLMVTMHWPFLTKQTRHPVIADLVLRAVHARPTGPVGVADSVVQQQVHVLLLIICSLSFLPSG
jgi:hypothetical protein